MVKARDKIVLMHFLRTIEIRFRLFMATFAKRGRRTFVEIGLPRLSSRCSNVIF